MSLSGWLTKRGGKVKTWKRRWFVLEEDRLNYFKTPSDMTPLGFIPMQDSYVKVANEKKYLFELYNANEGFVQSHKTYLISADNLEDMNQWVSILQKRTNQESITSRCDDSKDVIRQGWLNKRGGRRKNWKKRWFVLTDNALTLFYYRHEKEKIPLGLIPFGRSGVHITSVDKSDPILSSKKHCFLIHDPLGFNKTHKSYYLQASGQKEVQEWISSITRLRQMFEDEMEESKQNIKIVSPEFGSPTIHRNTTYNRGSLVFEVDTILHSSDVEMIPNSAVLIINTIINYLETKGLNNPLIFAEMKNSKNHEFFRQQLELFGKIERASVDLLNLSSAEASELLLKYIDQLSIPILPAGKIMESINSLSNGKGIEELSNDTISSCITNLVKELPHTNKMLLYSIIEFSRRLCEINAFFNLEIMQNIFISRIFPQGSYSESDILPLAQIFEYIMKNIDDIYLKVT